MQSELPSDFVLSTYYAMSREMLALASNKKSKPEVKKVVTSGCAPEDYRVKRVHDPTVVLNKLNKGQLMTEVLKRDEEVSSIHQELNNFAALKNANKKYELQISNFAAQCTIDQKTLEELHNLVSDKETLLERAEVLTVNQTEVMAEMTAAALKKQQSIDALEFRLSEPSEAMTMHQQKKDTITDMQSGGILTEGPSAAAQQAG